MAVFTNTTSAQIDPAATGGRIQAAVSSLEPGWPPVVTVPFLDITRTSAGLTLTFRGTLQSSEDVNGTYTDLDLSSPVGIPYSSDSLRFYRIKTRLQEYIYETTFQENNLPAGWIEQGGWTVTSEGLQTPLEGGWGTWAVWNQRTTLERVTWAARVRLNTTNTQFALVRRDDLLKQVGTIASFDAPRNRLVFYREWNHLQGEGAVSINTTQELASPPVAGREYYMSLSKTDAGHHRFTVTDLTSGAMTTLLANYDSGAAVDSPGFLFWEGSVTVLWCGYFTESPKEPRVLFLGDSFTHGDSLRPDYDDRFCAILARRLNGNAAIAGMGGEKTASILSRLNVDMEFFRPQYVVVLLGANEDDFPTWHANIMTIHRRAAAIGATLVVGTILPRDNRQTFINTANQWIRTNGVLPYIDFAKAVTVNEDGVTRIPGLFFEDNTHPFAEGHALMAAQAIRDLPYVFNEETSFSGVSNPLSPPFERMRTKVPLSSMPLAP